MRNNLIEITIAAGYALSEATCLTSFLTEDAVLAAMKEVVEIEDRNSCIDQIDDDYCEYTEYQLVSSDIAKVLSSKKVIKANGWIQTPVFAPGFDSDLAVTAKINENVEATVTITGKQIKKIITALAAVAAQNPSELLNCVYVADNSPEDVIYDYSTGRITWVSLVNAATDAIARSTYDLSVSTKEAVKVYVKAVNSALVEDTSERDALIKASSKLKKPYKFDKIYMRLYTNSELAFNLKAADRGVTYLETNKVNDVDGHIPMTLTELDSVDTDSAIDCLATLDAAGLLQ